MGHQSPKFGASKNRNTMATSLVAHIFLATLIVFISFNEDGSAVKGLTVPRMRKRELPVQWQQQFLASLQNDKKSLSDSWDQLMSSDNEIIDRENPYRFALYRRKKSDPMPLYSKGDDFMKRSSKEWFTRLG